MGSTLRLGFDSCALLAALIRLLCTELGHQICSHSSLPDNVFQLLYGPVPLQHGPSKEVRITQQLRVCQSLTIRSRDLLQALVERGRDYSSSQFWICLDLCRSRLDQVPEVPYSLGLLGRPTSWLRTGSRRPSWSRWLSSSGEWICCFSHSYQAYQALEGGNLLICHLPTDVGHVHSLERGCRYAGGGQGVDERSALYESTGCQLRLRC